MDLLQIVRNPIRYKIDSLQIACNTMQNKID